MTYNIITCKGFAGNVGWFNFGDCMKSKLGLVILFFLMAILNRWVFGMMGIAFNMWIAAFGGIIINLILISLFGSFKLALGLGIVAGIIFGLIGGATVGSTTDGD